MQKHRSFQAVSFLFRVGKGDEGRDSVDTCYRQYCCQPICSLENIQQYSGRGQYSTIFKIIQQDLTFAILSTALIPSWLAHKFQRG